MANMLVTGGAGFIGSHLVEALLSEGHCVRVVDNFVTGSRENVKPFKEMVITADLNESGVADRACQDIEFVFHQAAIPDVSRSIAEPLLIQQSGEVATLHLLQACVKHKVRRVIFASSASVYGDSKSDLIPLNPYAVSKLACENYLRAFYTCHKLDSVSLRYFNVFGPRQGLNSYAGVISIFLKHMQNNQPPIIYGDGQNKRDFTFVTNIVNANLLALRAERPLCARACDIGCGASISLNQLVSELNLTLGTSLNPIYKPSRIGDIRYSSADLTIAEQMIGYKPMISFKDGIQKLLAKMAQKLPTNNN